MEKVILAFSGGLDTTYLVPYLIDKGYEVITATVNTGGFTPEQLAKIAEKSASLGAVEHKEIDAVDELYENFVVKVVQANYLRGGVYPACVGPERLVAAQKIAQLAKDMGVKNVAHGSTGAGNDQIRFDIALRALMDYVNIIVPIRDEQITRQQEVDYLNEKGIEVPPKSLDYSINVGVLGTTVGGGETKGTLGLPPDDVYPFVKAIKDTPDEPVEVKIGFEKGRAVSFNGEKMEGLDLINKLRVLAQEHGVGKGSHLGTTILGIKGRVVFESAAISILIAAHKELEKSVLTSKQIFWKDHLGTVWGDMVHEGLYFDPVVDDICAMIDSSQQNVIGEATVKLHKGNIVVVGSESKNSLLDDEIACYGEENSFWDGNDAKGFAKIYGLEGVIAHKKHNK